MAEELKTTEEKEVKEVKAEGETDVDASEKKKKSKKIKRQILKGRAVVKCTYNNTVISLADVNGNVLAWSTSGLMGFKGAKKATPYAASIIVRKVVESVKDYNLKEVQVFVKGVGMGREAAVRSLYTNGLNILSIKDVTPLPHNGCRARGVRRV